MLLFPPPAVLFLDDRPTVSHPKASITPHASSLLSLRLFPNTRFPQERQIRQGQESLLREHLSGQRDVLLLFRRREYSGNGPGDGRGFLFPGRIRRALCATYRNSAFGSMAQHQRGENPDTRLFKQHWEYVCCWSHLLVWCSI